jgi:hypothetical protein
MNPALLFLVLLSTQCVYAQHAKEEFRDFCGKFFSDSTVQRNRVKFPLKRIVYNQERDSFDTTQVPKNKWGFSDFGYWKNDYNVQLYDLFSKTLRDTGERVVSFEGVENGIDVSLYFKLLAGKWYLVLWEDSSD